MYHFNHIRRLEDHEQIPSSKISKTGKQDLFSVLFMRMREDKIRVGDRLEIWHDDRIVLSYMKRDDGHLRLFFQGTPEEQDTVADWIPESVSSANSVLIIESNLSGSRWDHDRENAVSCC